MWRYADFPSASLAVDFKTKVAKESHDNSLRLYLVHPGGKSQ